MRARKFTSSLVFAAIAGLAAVPYLLVALPALGLIRPLCQHTWDISPLEISVEGGGGSTHEYVGRERDLGGIGGSP